MNHRQRKKKAKKAEYSLCCQKYWNKIFTEKVKKDLEMAAEAIREAARIVNDGMDRWAEEIKTAAGFLETEEMLRKSQYLPEGAEVELLKHIGIRVDRDGVAIDFYYDEANDTYFWMDPQERRKA